MKKIKVLWGNKDMMVLDKPAGVAVHGDGKNNKKEWTIADYILKNYPKIKGVGENMHGGEMLIERPGIVHRLDKDTSGCLIIAKTQAAYENLKSQFQTHKIKKEYIANVWGTVPYDTGLIDLPIARSKNDFRKKEVVRAVGMVTGAAQSASGGVRDLWRGEERNALTRYRVVKRLEKFGEKVSVVNFYPETGRTHQIRVHARSMGHPIIADNLYGPRSDKSTKFDKKLFKTKKIRHLLHARSITFLDPKTNEVVKVESKIPKEFL